MTTGASGSVAKAAGPLSEVVCGFYSQLRQFLSIFISSETWSKALWRHDDRPHHRYPPTDKSPESKCAFAVISHSTQTRSGTTSTFSSGTFVKKRIAAACSTPILTN